LNQKGATAPNSILIFRKLFGTVAFLMDIEKNKAWKASPFPCLCPGSDEPNIRTQNNPNGLGALLW
jgi:hypothetical protein